jgi:hypothetical protein
MKNIIKNITISAIVKLLTLSFVLATAFSLLVHILIKAYNA